MGSGSYSTVYLATHTSKKFSVVLKLLLRSIESDSLFQNEVSILESVNHPNIVKLLDHFETQDFYAVVLENIQGRELYEIISKDYSSLSRINQKEIFKQLVSGN